MGFLDKVIGAVNKVGTPIDSLTDTIGPSIYRKGDEVAAEGAQAEGRIVGIERKFEGDTDTELFALAIGDHVVGARIRTGRMERLRLGMPVLLRVADGMGVLDWPAMCARWGVEAEDPAQRPLRSAPEPGVKDTALAMGVKSHLKKWTPARATIVHMERRTILGGVTTQNWYVELELPDGSRTKTGGDVVPFYAGWLAVPGVEVPIVVDPKEPAKASVDWPAAANEAVDRAGGLDDPPPPGSVAELIEQQRGTDAVSALSASAAPAATADADLAPIEGVTLETWAAVDVGTARDRVPPADYDAYAARHGVPPGRWAAVDAAWRARMMGDWRIGAKIGEAQEAARKR